MEKKIKIGVICLFLGILVIGGLFIWNKQTTDTGVIDNGKYGEKDSEDTEVIDNGKYGEKDSEDTEVIDNGKYCEKDSDCVFLDFISCCSPPDPCKREPPKVVNKRSKDKTEQEREAKCPSSCPMYMPPPPCSCLNIEEFTPVCVDNECTIKRENNCEEYCKAIDKNESEACPWISNPDLITEENTEKCGCIDES